MHAPEVRKARRVEPFSRFGRSTERFGRLPEIVLEEPGIGKGAPDLDLLLAAQPRPLDRADEEGRRVRAAAVFQSLNGLPIEVGSGQSGDSIPRIQVGWVTWRTGT